MRVLAVIAALCAGPVAAQERMQLGDCRTALALGVGFAGSFLTSSFIIGDAESFRREVGGIETFLTPDGWCRIHVPEDIAQGEYVPDIDWRAPDMDGFFASGTLPGRLSLRLPRFKIGKTAHAKAEIAVQHVPDQGLLLIDHLALTGAESTGISGAGVIEGAYFSSIGAAQISFGGQRLTRFAGTANVTPQLVADLIPDLTGPEIVAGISELDFGQLDRASQAPVVAFAGDLPRARGVFDVDYASERGLGLIQITSALSRKGAEAVAIALSGATLTVDWQPQ